MRLPLSKIYRAFPELDRFCDAECDGFVRAARQKHLIRESVFSVVAVFAALTVMGVGTAIFGMYGNRFAVLRDTVGLVVTVGAIVLAGCISGLLVRDAWLRWAVRTVLRVAKCPACTYSLLGLPLSEGKVRCPECGRDIAIASLGLTPDDLIARRGER